MRVTASCEKETVHREAVMSEPALNWYALFVRSRHEFVTTEQLRKRGIETFLPTITKMRRWSDRNKAVTFPLFPGYLFVNIPPLAESFLNVIKTPGAVNLVSHEPGRPTQVDREEIGALKLMLAHGMEKEIDIYPHLWEGARVTVKQGPLQGAVGILVKKEQTNLFLVNIDILGRSVGMKINAEELDVI